MFTCGRGQVGLHEGRAARLAGDVAGGPRRELHQPDGPGRATAAVAELRLGVDDAGDQRRVQVLVARLLADDVLVAQRERDLLHRVVGGGPQDRRGQGHEKRHAGQQAHPPAPQRAPARGRGTRGRAAPGRRVPDGGRARAHGHCPDSVPRTSASCRSRSSTVPEFATTNVARCGLLVLRELARGALVDGGVAAGGGALRRARARRPRRRWSRRRGRPGRPRRAAASRPPRRPGAGPRPGRPRGRRPRARRPAARAGPRARRAPPGRRTRAGRPRRGRPRRPGATSAPQRATTASRTSSVA